MAGAEAPFKGWLKRRSVSWPSGGRVAGVSSAKVLGAAGQGDVLQAELGARGGAQDDEVEGLALGGEADTKARIGLGFGLGPGTGLVDGRAIG